MNQALPDVPIDLDRPRKLRYGFQCIEAVERLADINLLFITDEAKARIAVPNMTMLRAMFYGCLLDDDPQMTPQKAAELLMQHGATKILPAVLKAYAAATPAKDDSEATPDPPMPSPGPSPG